MRNTVHQRVQVGTEATRGVAVAAGTRLLGVNIVASSNTETRTHDALGSKLTTSVDLMKESADVSYDGIPTYEEIGLLLDCTVGNRETTELAVGAFQHDWSLNAATADDVSSLTVETGDLTAGERVASVLLSELSLATSRGGASSTISGSGFGLPVETGIRLSGNTVQTLALTGVPTTGTFTLTLAGDVTAPLTSDALAVEVKSELEALVGVGNVLVTGGPLGTADITVEFIGALAQVDVALLTATDTFDAGDVTVASVTAGSAPTELPLISILPAHLSVYIDSTQVPETPSAEFSLKGRFSQVWYNDRSKASFADVAESKPTATAKLLVAATPANLAIGFGSIRDGSTLELLLEYVGPAIGETGQNYRFEIGATVQAEDLGALGDSDDIYAFDLDLAVLELTRVRVVNSTETY